MDLTWSDSEEAFRAECREWLADNVPSGLPSGDTREGFAAHLEWERLLHAGCVGPISVVVADSQGTGDTHPR